MFFHQYILEGNFKAPINVQQQQPSPEVAPATDPNQAPAADPNQDPGQEQQYDEEGNPIDTGDGTEEDPMAGEEEPDPEPYLIPLKKFFLIQKLMAVKGKLDENRMGMTELDSILKFVNELPYETLLLLSDRIIELVKDHIKGITSNGKNTSKKSKV